MPRKSRTLKPVKSVGAKIPTISQVETQRRNIAKREYTRGARPQQLTYQLSRYVKGRTRRVEI